MMKPSDARPPAWAEATLRLLLRPEDREGVTGDLLEQYQDRLAAGRGRRRAVAWYVRQVAGFAWRTLWVWIVLLSAGHVGRTALDWRVPTHDFTLRSTVTTYFAIAVFASAGLSAAWRSRSPLAGVLAGAVISATSAATSLFGSLALLAICHDATMAAIQGSGGLDEMFTLPLIMIVPATIVAAAGVLAGKGCYSLRSHLAQ
jgi:hypothetical protein